MHEHPFGLTLAAAESGEGSRAEPPRELEQMWNFRTFGALPELGGLLDQPAGLLARMRHAERIYQIYDSFRKANNWTKWKAKNPEAWDLKVEIDKLRAQRD